MHSFTVSNAQDLVSALKLARAGDEVLLASGDYGDVSLSKLDFASDVTIRSADAGAPATFNSIKLNDVHNVVLDNVLVDFVPGAETLSWSSAVWVVGSSGISIVNSTIEGGPAVNGVPQSTVLGGLDSTGNVIGLPAGRGITIQSSSDVRIEGNDISAFHKGMALSTVDGLVIRNNQVHDLRGSPISAGDLNDVVIDGNHFRPAAQAWNLGGAGDHGDMIHIWLTDGSSETIHITNNFFEQGEGAALLGIFLEDIGNYGFTDVQIRGNVMVNGDGQGIRLESTTNSVIENNTLLGTSDVWGKAPRIVLAHDSVVVVRNNILNGDAADTLLGSDGNVYLQRHDANAANYYGSLFVDALSGHAGLAELQILPGSPLAALLAGAGASRFDPTPDSLTALIHSAPDPEVRGSIAFDASLSADPTGLLDAGEASFAWDFGDGTTGSGIDVDHVYAAHGSYEVVLRVTRGGSVDETHTTIVVADPVLLDLDLYSQTAIDGAVQTPLSAHHLNTSGAYTLAKASVPQIYALDEFTLSFSFKRDSSTAATGEIMRIHGSWYVRLETNGELTFQYQDAANQSFTVTTAGAGLGDAEWHSIDLTFDTDAGLATFYVDGDKVGQGSIGEGTQGVESWGFSLGNPFGPSADAMIGSLRLRDEALSADDIVGGEQEPQLDGKHPDPASPVEDVPEATKPPLNDEDPAPEDAADAPTPDTIEGRDRINTSVSYALPESAEVGTLSTNQLIGTAAIDLIGNDFANNVYGNQGANYLSGRSGNDTLVGHGGNDILIGGDGIDSTSGGIGDDLYYLDDVRDLVFEAAGQGNDRINSRADYALGWAAEIETLSTDQLAGTAAINLTGNGFANDIYGNQGANYLSGRGNRDTLIGHGGDDILIGGEGIDVTAGGEGDDSYYVDDRADLVVEATGQGVDRVHSSVSYTLAADAEVEILSTDQIVGTDAIDLAGNAYANIIYGNAGSNKINGGEGRDLLRGSGGADSFEFDTALDDSLVTAGANVDLIADFGADDRILLDDSVFAGLTPGALPSGAFAIGTTATEADDRILYDPRSGALLFDGDGNGAGAAVQFAFVAAGLEDLSASSFSVV